MKAFLFFVLLFGVELACAQSASPSPASSPAAAAASAGGLIGFLVAYKSLMAGVIVAVLDLIFALNPSAASNGILHWVLIQAKVVSGDSSSSQQPPAQS